MNPDLLIATYNSEKTIWNCIAEVRRNLPFNRIIAVDHMSKDDTSFVLDLFDVVVLRENKGLGYARQLQIESAETDYFLILDSDVVVTAGIDMWVQKHVKLMKENSKVGAVIGRDVNCEKYPFPKFWYKLLPYLKTKSFTLHCSLLRKRALSGIKIPSLLQVAEDYYIMKHLKKNGFKYVAVPAPFVHVGQYSDIKTGSCIGANFRYACNGTFEMVKLLTWKGLLQPLKLLPFLIVTKNLNYVVGNMKHTFLWVKGFLHWNKYMVMKR